MFEGRVAVITGAGSGIGRDMACAFAREGARVAITGRREAPLEETATLAAEGGARPLVIPADVSEEDQAEGLIARTVEALGPVDFLISNAAQPGTDLHVEDQTLENWNAVIGTNLTAHMLLSRACLKHMIPRRSGVILTFSSTAALGPMERKSHYTASKLGLIGFTRTLALEAGAHGIRVNCVVPGAIETELLRNYWQRIADERGVDAATVAAESSRSAALRRAVQPEEVTSTVLFLCSDAASAITGQQIRVCAGGAMW